MIKHYYLLLILLLIGVSPISAQMKNWSTKGKTGTKYEERNAEKRAKKKQRKHSKKTTKCCDEKCVPALCGLGALAVGALAAIRYVWNTD
jgi:hypothetical protein